MSFTPQFGDIAHLGRIELLTPKLDESAAFFSNIVGFMETHRTANSVCFRAWGDYQNCTLKLTASPFSGLGHLGLRVRNQATIESFAQLLQSTGVAGAWIENDFDRGARAFRFQSPDGHNVELYFETQKFKPSPNLASPFKNIPQRRPSAVTPLRLDHLNLLASDVAKTRVFFHSLGMKITEQIIFDNGEEMGGWLTATNKSYDIAVTKDHTGARGRLHHITYFMETREDILKMADILRDSNVFIETGPHKHSIGQTFFLYCYEPGGNRFEFASGGYSIFDPDWQPVVWTEAERKFGQAWGLPTISSFHTYGTPPVGEKK